MVHATTLTVQTRGRGTYDITTAIQDAVREASVEVGLCHVFIHHTSASLIICENADPDVRRDLETLWARLCPDADEAYLHTAEGPDDMAAHARSVLTQTAITIPVAGGKAALGTWQGLYLWEHRTAPHRRRMTISVFD